MNPAIVIAHKIPNRVRFKLSLPLKDVREVESFLMDYGGINDFEYNGITRSVLINFERLKIDLNEIILRLSVIYSKQYDMEPINVFTPKPDNSSSLVHLSIASIGLAAISQYFPVLKGREIVNFLSWASVGTTTLAILDHGYNEIKERGSFDPELVSAVYLFNAVKNGKLITGSFLTWLAAFGRHSLDLPYNGTTVKVKEVRNIFTGQPQYNISTFKGVIINDKDIKGKISALRALVSNYVSEKEIRRKKNYIMNDNTMLDTKEVGGSEVIGSSNTFAIDGEVETFPK